MISAIFFTVYIAYVVLLSIFIQPLYLIPVWLITGIVAAGIFLLVFIYINFIWMSRVSPMNKFKNYMARSLAFFIDTFVLRIRIDVQGKENIPKTGRLTTYANHKSNADPIPILQLMNRPTTFTPKSEVMSYPFIGRYLRYVGAFVIDRQSDRNTAKNLVNAIKLAKQGMNTLIFPEGGIKSRLDEQMVQMRPGAYKVATKAKTDILIISMKNMTQLPYNWPWKKTKLKIKIHPVIKYDEIKDYSTAELAKLVFDKVNADFE
jgi:1-acyl-sn-glycerol-3-phosphate acyltransferase